MKVIKFLKNHSPYVEGETASFSDEDADVRIQAGVAEEVAHYERQPDVRAGYDRDEKGDRVYKTVVVPDDLERNVDLPPTRAGGQAKSEENMTDEEKERAKSAEAGQTDPAEDAGTRSLDSAPVDKMAKGPSKKK